MTAEIKKGRYVYYRCAGFKGRCGNTYIRQESLSQLLATTVDAIQIPGHIATSVERAADIPIGRRIGTSRCRRPARASSAARSWRGSIAATTTTWMGRSPKTSGRGSPSSGRPNDGARG